MKPVKKLLSLSLALTFLLTCALPLGALAAKSFSDVKGHWAEANITKAVDRGYINGYENGTFKPNNSVTRAEFCKMINNALGLRGTTSITFLDVNSGDWFYTELSKAVAAGYITGYEDGTFRANGYITRQEAAVVLSRLVAEPESKKSLAELADGGSIASWAQSAAQTVYSKGYMAGDTQKKFNPAGNLTRAEAVKTIEGVLGKETVTATDSNIAANQSLNNTIYTGNLTISGTGSITMTNCSVLGSVSVNGDASVRLNNTKIGRLTVNTTGGKAEITVAGSSEVRNTTVSSGATLTENSLTGNGFQNLTISGTSLTALGETKTNTFLAGLDNLSDVTLTAANTKNLPITLSGKFDLINVNSPANLVLRSGTVTLMSVAAGGAGSQINLASGSVMDKVILNAACDFTGTGVITLAQINVAGSTFETMPRTITGNAALIPSITPKNGATDVAAGTNIVLTFSEIPYTASGTVLTSSYLEGGVVELHKGSESGPTHNFSTSLATNNREITIKPSSGLAPSTKYYVVIKAGTMKNTQGQLNGRYVFSFTTAQGLIPETNPVDKSDTISVSAPITLTFPEAIYHKDGSSLGYSYMRDEVLELREKNEDGSEVAFSVSLSSDRKVITMTPDKKLSTDTTYYVVLNEGTIANSNRGLNSKQVFSFKTAESSVLVPVMEPANKKTNVSIGTDIVLTFDTSLYTENGGSVDPSYLRDKVFTLRRGSSSGSTVTISSISYNGKTVTLTPDSLEYNTEYYLVINADSLTDSSSSGRSYNKKTVLSFTTASKDNNGDLAPSSTTPKTGATGVSLTNDITLTFPDAIFESGSSKNELSNSYLRNSVIELREGNSSNGTKFTDFTASINSSNKTITIDINNNYNLRAGTRYYLIVNANTIQNEKGLKNERYVTHFNTTGGALVPDSVSPTKDSTNNSINPSITFKFKEDIYDNNRNRLSDNNTNCTYLKEKVFELHRGSESGEIVTLNVSSIDSYRTVNMRPNKELDYNTEYYLIMLSGRLYTSDGSSNERQVFKFKTTNNSTNLTMTATPTGSNIGRNATITLTFSETIYNNSVSGNVVPTQDYLRNKITFANGMSSSDVTMTVSGNKVTITPVTGKTLRAGTNTINITSGAFKTSGGKTNSTLSTTFTTGAQLSPTVSPGSSSTLSSNGAGINLTFFETLYKNSGASNPLSQGDLNSCFKLTSPDNPDVSITSGSLSNSDGKTNISLTFGQLVDGATYALETKYALYDANGNVIPAKVLASSYRTTAPAGLSADLTILQPSGDGKQELRLRFSRTPYQSDGTTSVDPDYILRKVRVTETGGSTVTIDSARRVDEDIYLTVNSALKPNTSYTLTADAGAFANGTQKSLSLNKSSTSPALTIGLTLLLNDAKTQATATMSYNYPGSCALSYIGDNAPSSSGILSPRTTPGTSVSTDTFTIKNLPANPGVYTVEFTFRPAGGTIEDAKKTTASFTLAAPSNVVTLRNVFLKDSRGVAYSPDALANTMSISGFDKGLYTLEVATSDPKATVTFKDENDTSNDKTYELNVNGNVTIEFTVTAEDTTTTQTYTLTLTPN